MRAARAAIGLFGLFGALWKVWRWLVERDGLILVTPDEPDYSLTDLGREVRNFGSVSSGGCCPW